MQTYESPLEELPHTHTPPTVVIGVADDKARKYEEEIDGQIAVIDTLVEVARGKGFEEVKTYHRQGRHAAQAVENGIMLFCIGECRRRYSVWFHCTKVVAAAG